MSLEMAGTRLFFGLLNVKHPIDTAILSNQNTLVTPPARWRRNSLRALQVRRIRAIRCLSGNFSLVTIGRELCPIRHLR